MNIARYHNETLKIIEAYLDGRVGAKEASDWATEVVRSEEWERLPELIRSAVHLLFDLHDSSEAWSPGRAELESCRAKLKNRKDPMPEC